MPSKGGILKFMLMAIGQAGFFVFLAGLPGPPSAAYPFGKPADYTLMFSGILMLVFTGVVSFYIFHYRKLVIGRDYYWIGAVIRDLYGNQTEMTFAIPKGAEEQDLEENEVMLLKYPMSAKIVRSFEEELKEKFVWRKIPAIIYSGETGEKKYEGLIVVGLTESLLANVGETGFKLVDIDLQGLPATVEYAPLEFLELGEAKIVEVVSEKNPAEKILGRFMSGTVEKISYYENASVEKRKLPFIYREKHVPCLLMLGSPLMYQKLAAYGLGLLKLYDEPQKAIEHLAEIRQKLYTTYASAHEEEIRVRDKHIAQLVRATDRAAKFGIRVNPQELQEGVPARSALTSNKLILIILIMLGVIAFLFGMNLGRWFT